MSGNSPLVSIVVPVYNGERFLRASLDSILAQRYRPIDVLVMVLLGGLNALFGPLVGAGLFTWLQDTLARVTDYWRALVGGGILVIVLAFPNGIGGVLARRSRSR